LCRLNGRRGVIAAADMKKLWTYMLIYIIGITVCCTAYALTPFAYYVMRGEIIPLLPVEIIFLDQSKTNDFVIASITHLMMGSYAGAATVVFGSGVILIIFNYTFQVDIIAEDFIELDEMWKNNIPLETKRSFLRNICRKRQDMNRCPFFQYLLKSA